VLVGEFAGLLERVSFGPPDAVAVAVCQHALEFVPKNAMVDRQYRS